MQTQILIILILLPFLNFGQDLQSHYKSIEIRKEIRKVVKKIAKKNEIHTEAVGYAGEKTSQYKRFENLVEKANDKELLELMDHPNPIVRGYSFWALAKRHYDNLAEVYIKHANDESRISLVQGCFGGDTCN